MACSRVATAPPSSTLAAVPVKEKRKFDATQADRADEGDATISVLPRSVISRSSAEQTEPQKVIKNDADAAAAFDFVLYTDGAALGNGQRGARAGAAVWADQGRVTWSGQVPGSQTNQRAELWAAIAAASHARHRLASLKRILVRSDSTYVVSGINEPSWLAFWVTHQWHKKSGGPVSNVDLWCLLHSLLDPQRVVWQHVDAHSGIEGNEAADRLAKSVARAITDSKRAAAETPSSVWPDSFAGQDFSSAQRAITAPPAKPK